MAQARARAKLCEEIDRTLRRIAAGEEEFDAQVDVVRGAETRAAKDRQEAELQVMIKKLQRMRDAVKLWQLDPDARERWDTLQLARHSIDRRMEVFRDVERDTKTKAYSKTGMARTVALTPEEARRAKARDWLDEVRARLADGVDACEAELEALDAGTAGAGRTTEQLEAETARLTKAVAGRRWHMERLEALERLLDNEAVQPDEIEAIEDDLEFFCEHADDADYEMDEGVYDEFAGLAVGAAGDDGEESDDEEAEDEEEEEQREEKEDDEVGAADGGAGNSSAGAAAATAAVVSARSARAPAPAPAPAAAAPQVLLPALQSLPLSALLGDELRDDGVVTAWRATSPGGAPAPTIDVLCVGCEADGGGGADGAADVATSAAVLAWLLEAPAEAGDWPSAGGPQVLGLACTVVGGGGPRAPAALQTLTLAWRGRAVVVHARARKALRCAGVLLSGQWPARTPDHRLLVAALGLAPAAAALAAEGLARLRLAADVGPRGAWPAAFGAGACERDAPGHPAVAATAPASAWAHTPLAPVLRRQAVLDAWAAERATAAAAAGGELTALASQLDPAAAAAAAAAAAPPPPGAPAWVAAPAPSPGPAGLVALSARGPLPPQQQPDAAQSPSWATFAARLHASLAAAGGPLDLSNVGIQLADCIPPGALSLTDKLRRVPGIELFKVRTSMFVRAVPTAAAAAAAATMSPPAGSTNLPWHEFEAALLAQVQHERVRCTQLAALLSTARRPALGPDGAPAPTKLAELLALVRPPLELASEDGALYVQRA